MSLQKTPRQKHIRCLERRAEYLENRIKTSKPALSYDKAESNALRWALNILKEMYPVIEPKQALTTVPAMEPAPITEEQA